jgi:type II secretory pathway pseudopilin PulG
LVVCAIVLILAGAAAPHLMRVAQVQNTNNVLAVLRAINLAQAQFEQTYAGEGYALSLGWLANSQIAFGRVGAICQTVNCQCPNLLAPSYASIFSTITPSGSGYTGTFAGYVFTYAPGFNSPYICEPCSILNVPKGVMSYTLTAVPQNSMTGAYTFFTDQSGVIRYAQGSPAVSSSPIWGE